MITTGAAGGVAVTLMVGAGGPLIGGEFGVFRGAVMPFPGGAVPVRRSGMEGQKTSMALRREN